MDEPALRAFFGPNLGAVRRFWLPFEPCYKGRAPLAASAHVWAAYALMWRLSRAKFRALARDYDVIHLNSVVLFPVVDAELPCVVHVREIVDRDLTRVTASLERARGVIFIDEATRAPFAQTRLSNSIILNNPVDMTGVDRPPADAEARLGAPLQQLTVFAIIGALIPEKGVDRVIRAFRRTHDRAARLIVVGEGAQETALRALAAGDDRIVFWGQVNDTDPIFALADYVLRGESYPCVGRTIYEALYAGCGVIIPGSDRDHTLFEYERFATRVTFYPPDDLVALHRSFEAHIGHKHAVARGESNAGAYATAFESFASAMR
jgi:glycosyltransferase involved in cell wall biosynthesis